MNIAIVGTGYVGLVTGTCLANFGNTIFCVDVDAAKIEKMKQGILPIYEPHLEEVFTKNIEAGRLHFTTQLSDVVDKCQVFFLALPTPPDEDGSADLSYVMKVAKNLGGMIKNYTVVVNKSTVPVGTAKKVRNCISELTDVEFDVVSNPEFLREGYAVEDFMKPSRVIIGSKSKKAIDVMKKIYHPLSSNGTTILEMDEESSELTKYAANSFLATKITFMNEVANYCELIGADIDNARKGMGSDDRIGSRFLFPGIGYGGSCFPKDVKALISSGRDSGMNFQILESVQKINQSQKKIMLESFYKYYQQKVEDRKVAFWGLAFKPNTDDIRDAPALEMIDGLLKKGVQISVYDPAAMENVEKIYASQITFGSNMYSILQDVDALFVATEWPEFCNPGFHQIKQLMKCPVIFDGRNIFDLEDIKGKGFYYKSIGRQTVE